MAEILAIAAASLQLSEIFLKLSTRGGKLIIRLKSSRNDVELKSNAVEDFQKFCESSRRLLIEHGPRFDEMIQPSAVLHIEDLLRRAESIVDALDRALSELCPQSTDGRYGALRKSIKAVQRTEGITTQFNTLADIQGQINTYFIQHVIALIEDRSAKTEAGILQIHTSQTRIEKTLFTMEQQQSVDQISIVDLKMDISSLSGVQQSVSSQMPATVAKIDAGFASIEQSSNNTQAMIRNTRNSLEDFINRRIQELHISLRGDMLSNIGSAHLAREIKESDRIQPLAPTPVFTSLNLHASPSCPCQRSRRADQLTVIGPITIVSRKPSGHRPECRFYQNNPHNIMKSNIGIELSEGYRNGNNTYLMRFLVATSSFLTGFTRMTRFVNDHEKDAPGFKHISKATSGIRAELGLDGDEPYPSIRHGRLSPKQLQQCRGLLMSLHNSLLEDFRRSQDWISIQTVGGKTLLHALSDALKYIWTVQEEVSDIVDAIIHLLVKGGTSVTASIRSGTDRLLSTPDGKLFFETRHQTALSSCIHDLFHGYDLTKSRTVFLRMLAKHDVPAISSSTDHMSLWAVPRLFSAMPDLAFEYGCSRLCEAVIERRYGEVEQLLDQGRTGEPSGIYTPLLFAMEWIPGIKLLLKAGSDPSQAVHCAIINGALESLEVLMQADTWYFRPENESKKSSMHQCPWQERYEVDSLIEVALMQKYYMEHDRTMLKFNPKILAFLIERVANARTELMKLAKQHFKLSQLENWGWCNSNDPYCKLDSAAIVIYRKLVEYGISCPKSIFPGTTSTIYHSRWITNEIADAFWNVGFRDIDVYDEQGMTPMWLSTQVGHGGQAIDLTKTSRMLNWFLIRGARNLIFPALKNVSLVHKLAAIFGNTWPSKKVDPMVWLPDILHLCAQHLPDFPRDDCVCYCTDAGCSQITSLIKHLPHWNVSLHFHNQGVGTYTLWETKTDLFRLWMNCCPQSLPYTCAFYDLCRIELFDRLGMRHTCCEFEYEPYSPRLGSKLHVLEYPEAMELREEDTYSEVKLRSLMRLYDKFCLDYKNDFETFWKTWWIVLDSFVPEARFSSTLRPRPIRILPEYLPLPFDSLNEALLEIRKHVTTSMEKNLGKHAILPLEAASRGRRKSI
ncbi:hypothetical protein B0J11DRAFT_613989 [Dendryphion nanum]|uniref:Ankyrin repeat protein n=1 Tax=Dendryphion nanum TaxID=256645 RepID=A0A9P9IN23_9PLEO|nr:hypothetical protein B0J11DRAFT_613989 [Dendryphion nanum]